MKILKKKKKKKLWKWPVDWSFSELFYMEVSIDSQLEYILLYHFSMIYIKFN